MYNSQEIHLQDFHTYTLCGLVNSFKINLQLITYSKTLILQLMKILILYALGNILKSKEKD